MRHDSWLYLVHTGSPSSEYTAIWSIYALLPENGYTAQVVNLLDTICLSPAYSSNPGDYIEANREAYDTLVGMGADTLEICFALFLRENEMGLRGHIMALACKDILTQMGETLPDQAYMTGQEWFDSYRSFVRDADTPGAKLLRALTE